MMLHSLLVWALLALLTLAGILSVGIAETQITQAAPPPPTLYGRFNYGEIFFSRWQTATWVSFSAQARAQIRCGLGKVISGHRLYRKVGRLSDSRITFFESCRWMLETIQRCTSSGFSKTVRTAALTRLPFF